MSASSDGVAGGGDDDQVGDLREQLNMTLSAAGAVGSWDWDVAADQLHFDDRLAALYGLDPVEAAEGLPTQTFFTAIHSADFARIKIAVAAMLHGAEVFHKTYRLIGADGLVRWVEAHGRCHFDLNERPVRFAGVLVDVTSRRRVEERLRIAQSAGGVGTFEHVPGFATATVSEQFCRLLGLHLAADLPVATINRLTAPGSPPLLDESGDLAEEFPYAEICIRRADTGETRWIARRGEAIRENEAQGLRNVGVIYDITDSRRVQEALENLNETLEARVEQEIAHRTKMEEALRQAQKMEAVGQLTGGIAHDFNNLLTIILGSLDMAARRLPSDADERVIRAIANASHGADRAVALTQRLLAFSRRQPLDPKRVDIGQLLSEMTGLLASTIGEAITLQIVAPAELWPVEVDPNQLENAILNLAVNARDAMQGAGALVLTGSNLGRGSLLHDGSQAPCDYVAISIADTGPGMPEDVIDRAFEPFFTTKDVGKGTGLGLSMVYGFAKQSNGDVSITSAHGAGTTIYLYLPRLEGITPIAPDNGRVEAATDHANAAILVVEDDADVRRYTVESLRELGYSVLEASEGAAALELLAGQGSEVDLILTDVVMPGMSGREFAAKAAKVRPNVRVLYTSGYPRDVIMRDGRLESGVALLPKPFTYQALAAKVRDILGKAA